MITKESIKNFKFIKFYFYIKLIYNAIPLTRKKVRKLLSQFSSIKFKKRKIILYRAIRLELDADPVIEKIGRHWTINPKKAHPYGSKVKNNRQYFFRYTALAPISAVNWKMTIEKTFDYNSHEKEIVLYYNRDIEIINIEKMSDAKAERINDKWVIKQDIEQIEKKYFCKV